MLEAKDHPTVKKYVEEAKALRAATDNAAERLWQIAQDLRRFDKCGQGYACACTGACHPPEYNAILNVIDDLRKAQEPE